ncbi:hypothetical protein [Streptomyces sp. SPB162]|uniref:hypothetical protein n=1 Tax=Streptomyces sp. SPB162 TaxID=2940560 RepID=UPI002A505E05|nr:hypothetical protein [Streptomyces sp. SPB162]
MKSIRDVCSHRTASARSSADDSSGLADPAGAPVGVRTVGVRTGAAVGSGQRQQHRRDHHGRDRGARDPHVLAPAQQIGRPRLHRARVELAPAEQHSDRPGALAALSGGGGGLGDGGAGIGDARRGQHLADLAFGQPLQRAQRERCAGGAAEPGERTVQRQFVRAARLGVQPQPPHVRQRQPVAGVVHPLAPPLLHAVRHCPAQHLLAHQRIRRIRRTTTRAARVGGGLIGRAPPARQRPLHEGVRGQHPAVPAESGRQRQIRQPHQVRIVLDDRGLGLLDLDGRGTPPERVQNCRFRCVHTASNE